MKEDHVMRQTTANDKESSDRICDRAIAPGKTIACGDGTHEESLLVGPPEHYVGKRRCCAEEGLKTLVLALVM